MYFVELSVRAQEFLFKLDKDIRNRIEKEADRTKRKKDDRADAITNLDMRKGDFKKVLSGC